MLVAPASTALASAAVITAWRAAGVLLNLDQLTGNAGILQSVQHCWVKVLWQVNQGVAHRDALDEMHDRRIAGFPVIVGCAGCFPTAVALAAAPALRAGLIDLAFPVIADCLSGVSGAGRKPTARTSFCTANESMEAYGLPRHRHEPEMEMELSLALPRDPGDDRPGCPPSRADAPGLSASAPKTPRVMFTPHLVPLSRGMIATVHLRLGSHADPTRFRRAYEDAYASSPFVRVLKEGASPKSSSVTGTNDARIGLFPDRKDGWATAACARRSWTPSQ